MTLELCESLITREPPFTGYPQQLLRITRQNAWIAATFVAQYVNSAPLPCQVHWPNQSKVIEMPTDNFGTVLVVPDKILFHYTSEDGFKGIMTSKAIWATEIRSLNDESEIHYGIEFTQKYIEQLGTSLSNQDVELLTQVTRELDIISKFSNYSIFVSSFCADGGNRLEQWKSYADDGKGFSVGFDFSNQGLRQRFEYSAAAQGLWFAQCVYSKKKQIEIVHNSLMVALAEFHKLGCTEDAARFASVFFLHDFLQIATRLKHPAFSGEKEWRSSYPTL
jgi:hypothetical protein